MKVIATKLKRKFSPICQLIMGINLIFCSLLFALGFISILTSGEVSATGEIVNAALLFGVITAVCIFVGIYMISRFITWQALPDVIAEFDGHYLYIHGKNEIKIYVLELKNARIYNGTRFLRYDVFLWRRGKKRLHIPFTANPCQTRNKLTEIVDSIKV